MTRKEASRRLPNGAVELTRAKDADGIPVELTSRDVERMGSEAVAEYKGRRETLIAERNARAEDDDNLESWEGPDTTRRPHTGYTVTSKLPQPSHHLLQLVTCLTVPGQGTQPSKGKMRGVGR